MATKKKMNGKHVTVYPYYRHTGQDPMVGKVLDALSRNSNEKLSAVVRRSKVAQGTVKNWQQKKTRRPQHATMAAVLGASNLEFRIAKKS